MLKKYSIIKHSFFLLIFISFFANAQYSYKFDIIKKDCFVSKVYNFHDSIKTKKSNDGFYFGANLGFYFPNRYTAQYYNGANNVDSVLNYPINYQAIKQVLLYDFTLAELPAKMKYSPALMLGFFIKYSIKNSGIFMQFNFSKLNAKDVITLNINDPNNFSSEPTYKQEGIYGLEQRSSIDIGYSYTFKNKNKNKPYIEFGYNLNNTKFLDNKIKIENLEYSLVSYYFTYNKIEQGGIGMGAFCGGGVEMNFNKTVFVNPGFNVHLIKTKLGDFNKIKPNYSIFIRFILNGLV